MAPESHDAETAEKTEVAARVTVWPRSPAAVAVTGERPEQWRTGNTYDATPTDDADPEDAFRETARMLALNEARRACNARAFEERAEPPYHAAKIDLSANIEPYADADAIAEAVADEYPFGQVAVEFVAGLDPDADTDPTAIQGGAFGAGDSHQ